MQSESFDSVVIGGNIRGLVTSYVLGSLGYRVLLLERSPRIGGADASFVTKDGTTFDHGLHVLDHMRSEVATRLFTHVVDGAVHQTTLRRGLALRGHLMPYAPTPEQMPEELRALLQPGELTDDIGDELPTRERIARHYGKGYADLIFDEVLPSFPSESRHLAFGVDEARLLPNLYPWFFPRARRKPKTGDASRAFHDRLREGILQDILYPREGGFGGFAAGFVQKITAQGATLVTGAGDLALDLEPGTHTVRAVHALGRRFTAPHYFWATSWDALCKELGLPCQVVATDRVMLGSFRFDRPPVSAFDEILVGDPKLRMSRVYFPQRFRCSAEHLMQVEFAVPVTSEPSLDEAHWRDVWLGDARALGLIGPEHRTEEFVLKSFVMHFNAFGMEGVPLLDADPSLIRPDSNLHPVASSMANWNLNTHVPLTVAQVTARVCG